MSDRPRSGSFTVSRRGEVRALDSARRRRGHSVIEHLDRGGSWLNLAEVVTGNLEPARTDDEGVWKTILRTGTWKRRPGPAGRALAKPLHVVLDGPPRKGQVSLRALLDAFDDSAVEHVTIPLSHEDRVDENTGHITKLRIVEDEGGARLDALHSFTDASIAAKIRSGSILNTSCGILFDYVRKRDGKRYPIALGHVALTNKPWIDGMAPFGSVLAASEQRPRRRLRRASAKRSTHEQRVAAAEAFLGGE